MLSLVKEKLGKVGRDVYAVRVRNLQRILNERFGGKVKVLADALNYDTSSYISQVIGKNPSRNIGPGTARKIEKLLGLPDSWMDYADPDAIEEIDASMDSRVPFQRSCPVLTWAEAGRWGSVVGEEKADREHRAAPNNSSDETFALRIEGNGLEPRFAAGDIIFVDPQVAPTNGRFVVVQLPGEHETICRQLIVEANRRYLRHPNPSWPDGVTELGKSTTVCGTVIGVYKDL